MSKKTKSICHCAAYTFPHRKGGGLCQADEEPFFCENCREATEAYEDTYDYRKVYRSVCCGAGVFTDDKCSNPVTTEVYDDWIKRYY